MLLNLLLGLLAVAALSIMFLYLKLKKATLNDATLKEQTAQRMASEQLKIDVELDRRVREHKEVVTGATSAQEAINRRNAALRELVE